MISHYSWLVKCYRRQKWKKIKTWRLGFMPSACMVSLDIYYKDYICGIFFQNFWEGNSVLKYSFCIVLLMSKILQLEFYSFLLKSHRGYFNETSQIMCTLMQVNLEILFWEQNLAKRKANATRFHLCRMWDKKWWRIRGQNIIHKGRGGKRETGYTMLVSR